MTEIANISNSEGLSLDPHRNPLLAPNATFTQEYVAELSNSCNGLVVTISLNFNELAYPLFEISAEKLLNNYLYFMEAGETDCITQDFSTISNQLREWADIIDERTKKLNAQSSSNCCKYCDS